MQWLDTFTLVMRSQMTVLRERVENPERLIHQLILDMEEELEVARQRVAAAMADELLLGREVKNQAAKADHWMEQATQALKTGDETAAKAALARKRDAEERRVTLKEVYETQREQSRQLQEAFVDLEQKIRQARRKQRLLLAKMALSQLNDHLDEYGMEADELDKSLSEEHRKEQLERELEELKRRMENAEA